MHIALQAEEYKKTGHALHEGNKMIQKTIQETLSWYHRLVPKSLSGIGDNLLLEISLEETIGETGKHKTSHAACSETTLFPFATS